MVEVFSSPLELDEYKKSIISIYKGTKHYGESEVANTAKDATLKNLQVG
jgi:hypothetical protein